MKGWQNFWLSWLLENIGHFILTNLVVAGAGVRRGLNFKKFLLVRKAELGVGFWNGCLLMKSRSDLGNSIGGKFWFTLFNEGFIKIDWLRRVGDVGSMLEPGVR